MAKQIRHVSDLPAWFCLEKYAAVALLDAQGWYNQLRGRAFAKELLEDNRELDEFLALLLAAIRVDPIVDFYNLAFNSCLFSEDELSLLRPNKWPDSGVHPATVAELYHAEQHIEEGRRKYARGFFSSQERGAQPDCRQQVDDWLVGPLHQVTSTSGSDVLLSVDMSLNDSVLIEQFSRALNSLRDQAPEKFALTNFTARNFDFASWTRFGVLPYIDLRIWGLQVKRAISNRVMADAIFPPGEGGEEMVRKTTEKYAKELIGWPTIAALGSLGQVT